MSIHLIKISILLGCCVLGAIGKTMGPVGKVTINSVFECDEKVGGDDFKLTTELKSVDDKGTKVFSATFDNKVAIDQTTRYEVELRKLESGTWRPIITQKGLVCKDVQKIFPKIYSRITAALKPPLTQCLIKPGHYVLTNFQATSKEITIPTIFYGHFKIKIKLITGNKPLFCRQAEFDSQAP